MKKMVNGVEVEMSTEEAAAFVAQQAADAAIVVVPQEVTMRQARQALILAGKLDTINQALQGMQGTPGELARAEWEYSITVQRNRPLVLSLGAALGMSSADLDALFVQAATL